MSIQYGSLTITDIKYCNPQRVLKSVSSVVMNGISVWTNQQYQGLTFTFPTVGSIFTLSKYGAPNDISIYYSVDNGSTWSEWNEFEGSSIRRFVSTVSNQKMCVKGTTNKFSKGFNDYYYFNCDNRFYASGDVRSVINYEALTYMCFRSLFRNCTTLLSAPELNASVLAPFCYSAMFIGCSSLVSAPSFRFATSISSSSCSYMFDGCSSLMYANIPSASQVSSCYNNMFNNCRSITEIISSQEDFVGCSNWLNNSSSNGTFHCTPNLATSLTDGTYERTASTIPSGWTVIGDVT